MKIAKKQTRFCKSCGKHTSHLVSVAKGTGRSKSHPMSRGSNSRMRKRGLRRGFGNQGKYSKPPVAKMKRTGAKASKKVDLRYTCEVCKKKSSVSSPIRMKKPVIEAKE